MSASTVQIVQAGAPVVQPVQQQPPRNLSSIKGLAITQLIIGILTLIFGIAAIARLYSNSWTTNTGAGIWAGGWIMITGIIGVCSARNWRNSSLNGVYMAFSIISTCASALSGLFFIVAVVFYAVWHDGCYRRYTTRGWDYDCSIKDVGLGIHVPLLIMMVVEFFVSIVAAVFCCQNGCAGNRQPGAIIIQQPTGQVVMVTQPGNQGAYAVTQQYPGGYVAQPQYGVPQQQYNVQYTAQGAPPAYAAPPPQAPSPQAQGGYPPQQPMQAGYPYPEKPPQYMPPQ